MILEMPFPRWDPVLINLPGPLDIRWYGVMYLVGFASAYFILRRLATSGFLPLARSDVSDLVGTLVLGVLVGGRLGYLLFYDLPAVLARPLDALRVWEGGMSFHGGLLGVAVAAAWYARRHHISLLALGDALALATPFGLFAVRLANFINGELYGRIASASLPWGVRFPTDPVALRLLGADGLPLRERERRILDAYQSGRWDIVRPAVPLRHPSQLYEAVGEGVVLALLLWGIHRLRQRGRAQQQEPGAQGLYAGLFLVGYGLMRFVVEFFRQPDSQFSGPGNPLGTVLGPFTMGQLLSLMMLLVGTGLLLWRRRVRSVSPIDP